jgi:hypothetical protein
MNLNLKLYFKYILSQIPYSFIYFKAQKNNVTNIFITNNTLLYLLIHVKLSSLFYSSQLSDMFAYELPFIGGNKTDKNSQNFISNIKSVNQPSVVVYNFHSMFFHQRLFIFSQHIHHVMSKNAQNNYYSLNSITELFPAGN